MKNKEVLRVINIGESGTCSQEDLLYFLPNFPTLRGSEFIFTIGWANSRRYIDADVSFFVKGLHLIEMKYKSLIKSDFGFGSPSPSYMVIQSLRKVDNELADDLESWIREHGGNYYIK